MSCDGAGLHRQKQRADCDNGPRGFSSINPFLCCFFKLKVSHLRGNCVCSLFCRVQAILVSTRYERSARTYTQLLDKRIRYNSAEHAPCIFLRLHGLFFSLRYMEFGPLRGRLADFPPTIIHSPSFKRLTATVFLKDHRAEDSDPSRVPSRLVQVKDRNLINL